MAEPAAGYRLAMTRHGLADEIVVQAGDFSEDGGYTAAAALLDGGRRPITALTAVNDLAARCLLEPVTSPHLPGVEHLVAPRLVIRVSSAQPIHLLEAGR